MKIEYLIIGFFAIAILYVLLVYIFGIIKQKIKNKQITNEKSKPAEKPAQKPTQKPSKSDEGKIEVEHEVLTEKPIDNAIKDANIQYQINEAFEKINAEKDEYERSNQKTTRTGRLQVDRSDFNSELRSTRNAKSKRNMLKSEYVEIGHEGPTKRAYPSKDEKKDLNEATDPTAQTIADEINNMSPEAKAILINDILNKKY